MKWVHVLSFGLKFINIMLTEEAEVVSLQCHHFNSRWKRIVGKDFLPFFDGPENRSFLLKNHIIVYLDDKLHQD